MVTCVKCNREFEGNEQVEQLHYLCWNGLDSGLALVGDSFVRFSIEPWCPECTRKLLQSTEHSGYRKPEMQITMATDWE
jgi:hypothetical protein